MRYVKARQIEKVAVVGRGAHAYVLDEGGHPDEFGVAEVKVGESTTVEYWTTYCIYDRGEEPQARRFDRVVRPDEPDRRVGPRDRRAMPMCSLCRVPQLSDSCDHLVDLGNGLVAMRRTDWYKLLDRAHTQRDLL